MDFPVIVGACGRSPGISPIGKMKTKHWQTMH